MWYPQQGDCAMTQQGRGRMGSSKLTRPPNSQIRIRSDMLEEVQPMQLKWKFEIWLKFWGQVNTLGSTLSPSGISWEVFVVWCYCPAGETSVIGVSWGLDALVVVDGLCGIHMNAKNCTAARWSLFASTACGLGYLYKIGFWGSTGKVFSGTEKLIYCKKKKKKNETGLFFFEKCVSTSQINCKLGCILLFMPNTRLQKDETFLLRSCAAKVDHLHISRCCCLCPGCWLDGWISCLMRGICLIW